MDQARLGIQSSVRLMCAGYVFHQLLAWYWHFGFAKHYYNSYPRACRVVNNAQLGSEDLHITSEGVAFITSGLALKFSSANYIKYKEENQVIGQVMLYNFSDPDRGVTELQIFPNETFTLIDFRPHGISVLEDQAKGEHLIYVVNHPYPKPDTVEKFRFKPDTQELIHLKTFTSDALRVSNDLALVDEDEFYISNFIHSLTPTMKQIETLFQKPWSNILYFNGSDFREVAEKLVSPNGVVLSKDKRFLYAAMGNEKKIRVFLISADKSLLEVQVVALHTVPEKLHLSQDGSVLYAGTHPILYKTYDFFENPLKEAPSQVLSLPLRDNLVQVDDITQLLYDDGRLIKASTVAATYGDQLIVGSLLDSLVVCDNIPRH